jgi:hypothetical protein
MQRPTTVKSCFQITRIAEPIFAGMAKREKTSIHNNEVHVLQVRLQRHVHPPPALEGFDVEFEFPRGPSLAGAKHSVVVA